MGNQDESYTALMVHGPYGIHIHNAQRNDRPREVVVQQKHCYGLIALYSGSANLQDHARKTRIRGPAALFIPPHHPARLALHPASEWEVLRFDVMAVGLQFVKAGNGATTHRKPRPQPDPQAVWACDPPLHVAAADLPACHHTIRFCGHHWWRSADDYARANAQLHFWLTNWVLSTKPIAEPARQHPDPWVRQVQEHARAGLDSTMSVAQLAQQLSMSRVHLRRRLMAISGENPTQLLLRLRMERATELLLNKEPRHTIENIARQCGYRSTAAFVRAFTRFQGSTPDAWRQTISGRTGL